LDDFQGSDTGQETVEKALKQEWISVDARLIYGMVGSSFLMPSKI
jgi:hypothetical protein